MEIQHFSKKYWKNRYLPTKNQRKILETYWTIFGKSRITGKIPYYVMSDKYGRKQKFSKLNPIGWPTNQIKLGGKGGGEPNK